LRLHDVLLSDVMHCHGCYLPRCSAKSVRKISPDKRNIDHPCHTWIRIRSMDSRIGSGPGLNNVRIVLKDQGEWWYMYKKYIKRLIIAKLLKRIKINFILLKYPYSPAFCGGGSAFGNRRIPWCENPGFRNLYTFMMRNQIMQISCMASSPHTSSSVYTGQPSPIQRRIRSVILESCPLSTPPTSITCKY
jgi:hypothetical protein